MHENGLYHRRVVLMALVLAFACEEFGSVLFHRTMRDIVPLAARQWVDWSVSIAFLWTVVYWLTYKPFVRELSRRSVLEQEVRLREELYRSALEDQRDLILLYTPNGKTLYANATMCRFLGVELDELQRSMKLFRTHFFAQDYDELRSLLSAATPEEPAFVHECRIRTASGQMRWIRATHRVFFRDDRTVTHIQAFANDIQAEHEARAAAHQARLAQESAERGLMSIVGILPVQVFKYECDSEGLYVATFEEGVISRRAGVAAGALRGKRMEEVAALTASTLHRTDLHRAFAGEMMQQEVEIGGYWYLWTCQPVFDEHGDIQEVVGAALDVSVQKQASVALKRSEARFRAVFESSFHPIWLLSQEGTLMQWNYTAAEIVEGNAEAVSTAFWQTQWARHLSSSDRQQVQTMTAQACEGITERASLHWHDARAGQQRVFDLTLKPVYAIDGSFVCVIAEARDTTALERLVERRTAELQASNERLNKEIERRRRYEQELHRNYERYRKLADNLPNGSVALLDEHLRFQFVGGQELVRFGITGAMFEGQRIFETMSDVARRDELYALLRRAFQGETIKYEVEFQGQTYIANGTPLYEPDGSIKEVLVITQNITERKQAEAELWQRRQEFQALAEHAPDLIARFNRSLEFTYVNPVIETVTGLPPAAFIGKRPGFSAVQGAWYRERGLALLQSVAESGVQAEDVFSLNTPLGERWYQIRIVPEFASDGSVENVLAISRDITDFHRTQENIQNALIRERELNQMKSQFVRITSHELRTPLATIMFSCNALERYGETMQQAERVECYDDIKRAVTGMIDLMNSVLFIQRAESSEQALTLTRVEVRPFLETVIADVLKTEERGGNVQLSTSADTPTIEADHTLLWHIFKNLISNAVKYSPEHGTVSVEHSLVHGRHRFDVRDRGIGIAPRDIPHIFDVFHRGSNVGTLSGTGLGLAIAKQAVERHGGSLEVESIEGKGSVFTVILPAAQPTAQSKAQVPK